MADQIIGFQRVADADCCEFCSAVDGAFLKSEDAMPLHNGCGCSVEPILSSDPRAANVKRAAPNGVTRPAPLTASERTALEGYTGQEFGAVQRYLYARNSAEGIATLKPAERQARRIAEAEETIAGLDHVFAKQVPLAEDQIVHHGGDLASRLDVNGKNPGYLSTSKQSGTTYAQARGEETIVLPKGSRVIDVEAILGRRHGEAEVLLPRDAVFALQDDGTWRMQAQATAVHEHGELGPILGAAIHDFTGPSDI